MNVKDGESPFSYDYVCPYIPNKLLNSLCYKMSVFTRYIDFTMK